MKRALALIMVFMIAAAALAGCKKSSNSPSETPSETQAPQTQTNAPQTETQAPQTETQAPQTQDTGKTYFDQTSMYTTIVDLVDQNFSSYDHLVTYNRDTESLFLIFEAPANTRAGLESGNSSVMEAWKKVVDGFSNLSQTFYDSLHSTYGVEHVLVYMVEEMKNDGSYVADDIFLYVDNGVVTVNKGQ